MSTLIASYNESNNDSVLQLRSGSIIRGGQSFTMLSSDYYLSSCKFYIKKLGSPTGNVTASLYAHSGTYGTSSVGTGNALATSTTSLDISTLDGETFSLQEFLFDESFLMRANTYYVIVLNYNGGSIGNTLNIGQDGSSPGASGNRVYYISSWTGDSGYDVCFYVYGNSAVSGPANVKTFNALAKASVKSYNGLAVSSIKSINGLT